MAFKIKLNRKSQDIKAVLIDALLAAIRDSRFSYGEIIGRNNNIFIHKVRLKEKKGYCGNHPGACVVQRKHKTMDLLEGKDWVEWNDLLNDVMDELNVDADAGSSHVKIRKGRCRCIEYTDHPVGDFGHRDWDKDSELFEDWCADSQSDKKCGPAPRAGCPSGTPGGKHEDV